VRDDVLIDPDHGVPPPDLQYLRVKRHAPDLYDVTLGDGVGGTRRSASAAE
jgi:hypothetical protein